MIYLYGYLGIGVVILAYIAVLQGMEWIQKRKQPPFSDSSSGSLESEFSASHFMRALDAGSPRSRTLSYRILDKIVAPALAAIAMLAFWPVAIGIVLMEEFQKRRLAQSQVFTIRRQHLRECLTVQEIERREVITDPLCATPDLPFGHLHAAWQKFLEENAHGAALWSFCAEHKTPLGDKQLRRGYVAVEGKTPRAYILTVLKNIPQDTQTEASAPSARAKHLSSWRKKQWD